ncbi:hypothetical protein O181_038263 [Austropuccinia psidii MF-1]|uniref:Tf2-1-like SH3-like domain-containing protein n=1 Tax=Austropuccinia psidii MF-1 TaxID=1389203 RepID=A0A9Q3HAV5_9BASI|nr:hypothetical protein [Austropuccinia psidii MF-1]
MAFFQEHKINITHQKLSERWLDSFPILKKIGTHAHHLKLPSQWKYIHPVFNITLLEPVKTSTIPNKHQKPLLQSLLKKKRNGKSLKYWIPSSREENCGIWWNGKVSFKTQKDPLGNQPKTSRIAQNLSRISIIYILTSQAPILQQLDLYGAWWGEELPKVSPTPGMHL